MVTMAVFCDRKYLVVRKTIADTKLFNLSALKPIYSAVGGSYPNSALTVLIYSEDDVAREALRSAVSCERSISQPVEAAA
jgi:hypothetical protein